eukprot:12596335-Prorocentrum_lima.AAC.1
MLYRVLAYGTALFLAISNQCIHDMILLHMVPIQSFFYWLGHLCSGWSRDGVPDPWSFGYGCT